MMDENTALVVFQGKKIRRTWFNLCCEKFPSARWVMRATDTEGIPFLKGIEIVYMYVRYFYELDNYFLKIPVNILCFERSILTITLLPIFSVQCWIAITLSWATASIS